MALAIIFDGNPGNIFYAGQCVTGHVRFQTSERITMRDVRLKVTGKAKTYWREGGHDPKRYLANEQYLIFEASLLGSRDSDREVYLEPSVSMYPFSFALPAELPQSFEGEFGCIRYKIKAVVALRMRIDEKVKFPFTVIHLLDLNREPAQLRAPLMMSGQSMALGCCCGDGVIEISITINRGCFVPGETMRIDGEIVNRTNSDIKHSTIALVQTVEFCAGTYNGGVNRSTCSTTTLAKVDQPLTQRGQTDSWNNISIVVPQTYPSRHDGCRIINISYSLEISAIFNECFSKDSVVSCPVVIGNIPLQNNLQPSVVTSQPTACPETCNIASGSMPPPYEPRFNNPGFQTPNNDGNFPDVHRT